MTVWKDDPVFSRMPVLAAEEVFCAVQDFESISLDDMDRVKLMDRFDRKFVFQADQLPTLLKSASLHYRVLQISNDRLFKYSSTYYDTIGTNMYHDHHNRKLNRFKVRKREYLNSGQIFLEVKHKSNKGQTRKKRMETQNTNMDFDADEKKFLKKVTPYRPKMLNPVIKTDFIRITLVHKQNPERVTIDLNLKFEHAANQRGFSFLTIAEIKQSRSSGVSDLEKIFRDNQVLPMKFSKYCMGMVMLNPCIKYNRLKQKFLKLKKLSNQSHYVSINY